jgi:hypothetical protein
MADKVMERRRALCRGCEEKLVEEGSEWRGATSALCIDSQPGRLPVPHMPMPDGFRGAPQ